MRLARKKIAFAPGVADFAYRTIPPEELPRVMRIHILTGTMGSSYGTLTTGIFLVAFGNYLGVSIIQWGILGAVTSFAIVFQLVSAYWAARIGYRRFLWYVSEVANRLLRASGFGIAYVLYTMGHARYAADCLVLFLCLGSFFAAASQPPWFSWLADIIPEQVHGSFMGRRDTWISLVTLLVVIPAGLCLDVVDEPYKARVLAGIFTVGMLLGMTDLFMHRLIPEPPFSPVLTGSFKEHVVAPLADREFRPWLVFVIGWNFAMMLGGALCTVYFVDDLGLRQNFLGGSVVLIAIPLVSTMVGSRWMGGLIDRLGVKRVLLFCHIPWAVLPLFWILASPEAPWFWLAVASILGGAGPAGAINAANKYLTRLPRASQRAMYIAVNACVANLAGGLGPLLGGWFLHALEGRQWTFAGSVWIPFHLLFALSLVLRLAAWLLLFRIKSPAFDRERGV